MQWSQIKTLFILCFLVLNIYLFIEFYNKQNQTDSVYEPVESTIEEQLEQENITLPKLPDDLDSEKEPFITVEQKTFSDEEVADLTNLENQSLTLIDRKLIVSLFDEPVTIPTEASEETIIEIVGESVSYLDEYMFWDWNRDLNVLIFFQQKKDRPIYYNQNGLVLVFLNENNEMVFYSQTMLGEEEARPEKRTLISPIKAIETLYNGRELFYGDEINKVKVGFHTRIPSTNGVQVFVPTWKVTVNESKNYFVNAIEGYIFSSSEHEFLEETIAIDLERVQSALEDKDKEKDKIIEQYIEKLEHIKGDEEEHVNAL